MKGYIGLACLLALAGCATIGIDNSFANENNLYEHTVATLGTVVSGRDYCHDVTALSSRPFQSTTVEDKPKDLIAEEIWLVKQCGIRKEYEVYYILNDSGEYTVSVKRHQ